MAIVYPLTLPTTPMPAQIRIYPHAVVAIGVSPYTGQQQSYAHQGQFWRADITLPPMRRAQAEPWIATLLQLNGRRGTFRMGDISASAPRGVATGTPLVNGSAQSGQVLITDGWSVSTPNILMAGDYLQIGDHLYKNLFDVSSDAAGAATLDIWPRLRSVPADNAPITLNNPMGLFRMVQNDMPWEVGAGAIFQMSFSAVEAI